MVHPSRRFLLRLPPPAAHGAGTWGPEVEAEDGKIVITREDGSQAAIGYSEESDPAKARAGPACWWQRRGRHKP